jgi:hypothetical protein
MPNLNVTWRTRKLSGGRVRLFGEARLPCEHTVTDSAQTRDDTQAISQAQDTIRAWLGSDAAQHQKECKRK